MDDTRELSFYEAVGGEETFRRLTRLFYEGVAGGPRAASRLPEPRPRPSGGAPAAVPDAVLGRTGDL